MDDPILPNFSTPPDHRERQSPARILLVDDDYQAIEQVTRLLERFGYHSDFLLESSFLFEKLTAQRPDLILLDVNMPEIDGLSLLSRLKKEEAFRQIPVIMITGDSDDQLISDCFSRGAVDFVNKPIRVLELKSRIAIALATRRYIEKIHQQADVLRHAKEFSETVLRGMSDALWVVDARNHQILEANDAFLQEVGKSREAVLGTPCHQVNPDAVASCFGCRGPDTHERGGPLAPPAMKVNGDLHGNPVCPASRAMLTRQTEEEDFELPMGEDQIRHTHVSATPIVSGQDVYQVILLARDITERKLLEAHLKHLAFHDPLTGLPNRQLYFDRLEQAIANSRRKDERAAVLFFDLDRFKDINDRLGHAAGDRLLRKVAKRLAQCVRESDTVARLGGDEFTAILTNLADIDAVKGVAGKMMDFLAKPYDLGHEDLVVTSSIGISIFPDDGDDVKTLVNCADKALYQAKEAGRNTFRFFGPFNDPAPRSSAEKKRRKGKKDS